MPAQARFTAKNDGLKQEWAGRVYMNPPYGRPIAEWVEKLASAYEEGSVTEAIALFPARTDTGWYARLNDYPRCFIRGRLKFSGLKTNAPFPSIIVYLGPDISKFERRFGDMGGLFVRYKKGRVSCHSFTNQPC